MKRTMPFFEFNYHHDEIIEHLEMVEAGVIDRLIINTPPRHGKTTMVSIAFPSWYMGKNPRGQVITSAWGGDLLTVSGTQVRNRMRDPEHIAIFGEDGTLSADTKARDLWTTNAGGVYRAAGVGAGITGFGANIFIIDDPVKSREEADSKLIRDKTWNWYRADCYTRQMKGGAIVIIQTRWHEDDLSGRLLDRMEKETGDKFILLNYPAINQQGQALWHDFFPIETLERYKRVMGAEEFESLYQGNPTPPDGMYFKRKDIRTFSRLPDISRMQIYGASDYAVTHAGGDYTVHLVAGVDEHDDMYILDMWRDQTDTDIWIEELLNLMAKWKPILWAEEAGQIKKAIGPFIHKRQLERRVWSGRRQFSSTQDKPTRARAFHGRFSMGKVFFPESAPWWGTVMDEMLKFPSGTNDDIVDTLSLLGNLLDVMSTGTSKPGPTARIPGVSIVSPLPPGMRQLTYGEIFDQAVKEQEHDYA